MYVYNPGALYSTNSRGVSMSTLHPKYNVLKPHHGQDYNAPRGTAIPAAYDGIVIRSGWVNGYGNTVILEHVINGELVHTLYAHMNVPSSLKKGDEVLAAETIGVVGSSGRDSTGPHLHFEIMPNATKGVFSFDKNRVPADPLTYKFPTETIPVILLPPVVPANGMDFHEYSVIDSNGYEHYLSYFGTKQQFDKFFAAFSSDIIRDNSLDNIQNWVDVKKNPNDLDFDNIPNDVDDDIDGDGIKNIDDSQPQGLDMDNDGIPDLVDNDVDGDEISNLEDYEPNGPDYDRDGVPDVIDADDDGDSIPDDVDANNDAKDFDLDGVPDYSDADIDGDGIPNSIDSDPTKFDPRIPKPKPPKLPPPPPRDPLALDLNGDGAVNTLPMSSGIHFDLDNSGFAEQTSWVAPEDGLLVLDRNNNGFIDGGMELFGTETLLETGRYAAHGFEALSEFDTNDDNVIDSGDAIYSKVRVWRDANSNGIADSGELKTLNQLNIRSIGTAYTNTTIRDVNNVEHREAGIFTFSNAAQGITNTLWFESDRRITIPVSELQSTLVIPDFIKKLPNAVGFGSTYSLHHAMTTDATGALREKVQTFSVELNPEKRHLLLREILVLWTGKTGVVTGSRGPEVNATSLAILESFWGQPAFDVTPVGAYAQSVNEAYIHLEQSVYSQLMASTHMRDLLTLTDFTEVNGAWTADYSAVMDLLADDFLAGNEFAAIHLAGFVATIDGIDPYSDTFYSPLISALTIAADKLPDESRAAMLSSFTVSANVTRGSSTADLLVGREEGETIYGMTGDDVIRGAGGQDFLYGDAGDDILRGGTGSDVLWGGDGNDSYHYSIGDGLDTIKGSTGNDRLVLDAGISEADVTLQRVNRDDIIVSFRQGGSVLLKYMFVMNGYYKFENEGAFSDEAPIKEIVFNNNVVWDLDKIKEKIKPIGSDSSDLLFGFDSDDLISGFAGADNISGHSGSDTLNGGAGNDRLYGDAGNDQLTGGAGVDSLFGGLGDDAYYLNAEDVKSGSHLSQFTDGDYLSDEGGIDTIYLTENFASDFKFIVDGQSLYFVDANRNYFEIYFGYEITEDVLIENVVFADGVTLSIHEILAQSKFSTPLLHGSVVIDGETNDVLEGTAGNNTLASAGGNDTYYAGLGVDTLEGGHGDDRYIIKAGDGYKRIGDSGGNDVIQFGAGINSEDLMVTKNGSYLYFYNRDGQFVVIEDWSLGQKIERVEFENGDVWDSTVIEQKIQLTKSISKFSPQENTSFDSFTTSQHTGVFIAAFNAGKVTGGDGDDTIASAKARDTVVMSGGAGRDSFIINQGAAKRIDDFDPSKDFILFPEIDNLDDLNVNFGSNSYIPNFVNGMTIHNQLKTASVSITGLIGYVDTRYGDTQYGDGVSTLIDCIVLGNGEKYSLSDVLKASIKITDGNDSLLLVDDADYIDSSLGNDTVNGGAGDDTLIGGEGYDHLYGGLGNDQIYGGNHNDNLYGMSGDDYLHGGDGDDTLDGGYGIDTLIGGLGDDSLRSYHQKFWDFDVLDTTYIYQLGDGDDTILDYYGNDRLIFKDIGADDVELVRIEYDLLIKIRQGGSILIASSLTSTGEPAAHAFIEQIEFAGGLVWDKNTIAANIGGIDDTAPPMPTAEFNPGGTTIFGYAEASALVELKSVNDMDLGSVTADSTSGAYTITLATVLINKETVNVTAKDAAGNISAIKAIVAPDKTAPSIPTASFDAAGKVITGMAEAGSTVSVKNAGGTELKSATANATTGAYSITLTTALINKETVNVTAKDTAGNISAIKAIVAPDKMPPAFPTANFDTAGKVISGIAEAGSVVVVKNASNTSTLGNVTAHATTGAYSITLVTALINKETVNVTATDAAGNVSVARAVVAPNIAAPNPSVLIIQAESYTSMSGVRNENTSDVGGGQNAGYIEAGDWMAYNNAAFSVPAAGVYKVTYRVASLNGGGRLTLKELSNDSTLGSITVPKTSGWQNWVDVTQEITLSGGEHNFKLAADVGGFNINWFKLELVAATAPVTPDTTPPAQPTAVFDSVGKEITGVAEAGSIVVVKNASNTSTLGNVTAHATTGAYSITLVTALINKETVNVTATDAAGNVSVARAVVAPNIAAPNPSVLIIQAESYTSMSGVRNENTSDVGGGQNAGYIEAGDWMAYNNAAFSVPAAGVYKVTYRVASLNGGGRLTLKELSNDSTLGSITVPKTSGWQNWVDVTQEITLSGGEHNFKLAADVGGFNINWFKLEPLAPLEPDTTPPIQPTAAFDTEGKIITGVAEAGSIVVIKNANNTSPLGTVTAHATTGAYSIALDTALINSEAVNVSATDAAGNVSVVKTIISPDKTPPAQPVAAFNSDGKVISGVAEAGSVVVVKNVNNSSTLGTVTADATTGAYSITLVTALINRETVNITARDAAGNVSAVRAVVAPDGTAPIPSALVIQAENYTSMSGVQKENTSDVGGGQNASYIDAGDWMAYNNAALSVPTEGRYKVTYRVASRNGGGRLTLKELSNDSTLGSITVPKTGAWQSWVDVTQEITLSGGEHNFKLAADIGGFNINWFKLELLEPNVSVTTPLAKSTAMIDPQDKVITGIEEADNVVFVKHANNINTPGVVTADATNGVYEPAVIAADVSRLKTDYESVHHVSSNDALIQAMASFVSGSGVDNRYRSTQVEQSPVVIAVGS